jgi:DNA-binding IclR family transcriptional regulator
MSTAQTERRGIQSLEIGVRIFQDVHRLGRPVTLTELSRLSQMPPGKLHRYCVSLIRTGLLQQDRRGLYGIGAFGFQLGHADADRDHARSLALAALSDLVNATNETVFLSEWGQAGPRILQVVDAAKPISIRPSMQGEIPVLLSATGRVFAAFMDVTRATALIDAEIVRLHREQKLSLRDAKAHKQAFFKQLPEVRRRCLARTTGERYPGLGSFAAPIFDQRGQVVLALTSFGLATTFPSAWDASVPRALLNCATELTRRIGGRRPER